MFWQINLYCTSEKGASSWAPAHGAARLCLLIEWLLPRPPVKAQTEPQGMGTSGRSPPGSGWNPSVCSWFQAFLLRFVSNFRAATKPPFPKDSFIPYSLTISHNATVFEVWLHLPSWIFVPFMCNLLPHPCVICGITNIDFTWPRYFLGVGLKKWQILLF